MCELCVNVYVCFCPQYIYLPYRSVHILVSIVAALWTVGRWYWWSGLWAALGTLSAHTEVVSFASCFISWLRATSLEFLIFDIWILDLLDKSFENLDAPKPIFEWGDANNHKKSQSNNSILLFSPTLSESLLLKYLTLYKFNCVAAILKAFVARELTIIRDKNLIILLL